MRRKYKRKPIQKKSEGSEQFLKPTVQTKLNMGQPGDKYEVEADKMADQVVNNKGNEGAIQKKESEEEIQQKPLASSVTPLVQKMETSEDENAQAKLQRKEDEEPVQAKEEEEAIQSKEEDEAIQMMEEEEAVQAKCADCEQEGVQKMDEEEVQAKSNPQPQKGASIESKLRKGSGGKSMDTQTKSEMESGFGADFSHVNIHTDTDAQQMSQDIGAQAFTHGNDIYFNEGKYDPNSKQGKHLLAHELTHTIQQKGMVQKKVQKKTNTKKLTCSGTAKRSITKSIMKISGKTNAPDGTVISFHSGGGCDINSKHLPAFAKTKVIKGRYYLVLPTMSTAVPGIGKTFIAFIGNTYSHCCITVTP